MESGVLECNGMCLSLATWWQIITLETSSRTMEYPMLECQQGQVEPEKLKAYL